MRGLGSAARLALWFALIAVGLQLMGSAVFAGGYAAWVGGGANGTSPHSGYSDSSTKCKVCHAVHNANTGNDPWGKPVQFLLRSSRENACRYCHVDPGTVSAKRPYGQGAGAYTDNYVTERDWNHRSVHYSGINYYAGCTSCHATHGANTVPGEKDLKNNPGWALAAPVTNLTDFCRDCHNNAGDNKLTGGCFKSCHITSMSEEFFSPARDGETHIMTDTLTGADGSTQVAWLDSENCYSCHKAGRPYDEADSFPHYTPSAVQFLDYAYTTEDVGMDVVCLNCHTDTGNGGAYTSGVGKSY